MLLCSDVGYNSHSATCGHTAYDNISGSKYLRGGWHEKQQEVGVAGTGGCGWRQEDQQGRNRPNT